MPARRSARATTFGRAACLATCLCTSCAPSRRDDPGPPVTAAASPTRAPAPDKRRTVDTLLGLGPVRIQLDARRPGVDVPARHREDPQLVLRIGHALSPAIPDLVVDARGISATLRFGGVPYRCVVPWAAVYGATLEGDAEGTVWSADVP